MMQRGLYGKFNVRKWELGGNLGAKLSDPITDCFVLRPDRDPDAVIALRFYATLTSNSELADDLTAWLDEMPIP